MSRFTRLGDVLLFVLLFYRQVNTVICQVQAYVGDTVLLPCVYNEASPLPDTASVFWRDKDDNVVLNIKQRKPVYPSQHEKFRGRVFSEEGENVKANFSIVMKNVQQADRGSYECHIPQASFQRSVSLTVSEKRVEVAATTPPPGGVRPSGGVTAVTPTILHLLLPLLALTCSGFK